MLKSLSIEEALEVIPSNSTISQSQLSSAVDALTFVLNVPAEYLDKATRSMVMQTALVADILLHKLGRHSLNTNHSEMNRIQVHYMLRTLLFRILQETGNADLLVSGLLTTLFVFS